MEAGVVTHADRGLLHDVVHHAVEAEHAAVGIAVILELGPIAVGCAEEPAMVVVMDNISLDDVAKRIIEPGNGGIVVVHQHAAVEAVEVERGRWHGHDIRRQVGDDATHTAVVEVEVTRDDGTIFPGTSGGPAQGIKDAGFKCAVRIVAAYAASEGVNGVGCCVAERIRRADAFARENDAGEDLILDVVVVVVAPLAHAAEAGGWRDGVVIAVNDEPVRARVRDTAIHAVVFEAINVVDTIAFHLFTTAPVKCILEGEGFVRGAWDGGTAKQHAFGGIATGIERIGALLDRGEIERNTTPGSVVVVHGKQVAVVGDRTDFTDGRTVNGECFGTFRALAQGIEALGDDDVVGGEDVEVGIAAGGGHAVIAAHAFGVDGVARGGGDDALTARAFGVDGVARSSGDDALTARAFGVDGVARGGGDDAMGGSTLGFRRLGSGKALLVDRVVGPTYRATFVVTG